jgi:hypothetical protein
MAVPIELVLNRGSQLVVRIIEVDETSEPEILYEVLQVLRSPGFAADVPGALLGLRASEVQSWRVHSGAHPA